MSEQERLVRLRAELYEELTEHILPYWMEHAVDEEHGGFVGRVTGDGRPLTEADRGGILNARILWTFSAAYRVMGRTPYRQMAERAWRYVDAHFWDVEHGGVYWMVDHEGRPVDARKHTYAQAFAIYGVAEYVRAIADEAALQRAVALFRLLEKYGRDDVHGGYWEAFDRTWTPLDDVRLSAKDADEKKSMNTHLHVLEAYTNLYRVWPDAALARRLEALLLLMLDSVVDVSSGHMTAFFDEDWTPRSEKISYGHDIEGSWLLLEAADVLEDRALRDRAATAAIAIAEATLREGMDEDGGLFNEGHPERGIVDTDKDWWPQAEAVVGFLNAYQETGRTAFLQAALRAWSFVKTYVRDGERGEWFERVARDGAPYAGRDKVGPWKCPYHNARACLEVIERVPVGAAET